MNDKRPLPIYIHMHEYGILRNVFIDNIPWFVAKDVITLFGFPHPKVAVTDYVEGEDKRIEYVGIFEAEGGAQDVMLVNESAVYSLASCSDKPTSRKVKRWITQEVVPRLYEFIYKGNNHVQ